MARPKEFDRDVTLRKAVAAFRAGGFEGTSIQVLVDRMGIHRASLYDTYGSKEQLYRESLCEYEALVRATFEPVLEAAGRARDVVRDFFEFTVAELTHPERGEGSCLMLTTALTGARKLRGVSAIVRGHYDWFAAHFERLIALARAEGDVHSDASDAELASFLRQVLIGLIAGLAVDGDATHIRANVRRMLGLLFRD